ncbi:MAG: ABC transporter permease [Firmicutes bacterium]|nr:ABC transporter permease [Bacillota bacterium]
MKKNNKFKHKFFLIFYIFILSLLLCKSIYSELETINGSIGCNKLSVELKNDYKKDNGFKINNINKLNRSISSDILTYYTFQKSLASTEKNFSEVKIIGVSGLYSKFHMLDLKKGSFINSNDNQKKNYVAIIDDKLAKKLFKSENVIGLKIKLYGKDFTIIGVKSTQNNLIGNLFKKELPNVYMPINIINEIKGNEFITNIEYKKGDSYLNKKYIKDRILEAGKNNSAFDIKDYKIIGLVAKQKFDILIFIIGIFAIYRLIKLTSRILKSIIFEFKDELKNDYLKHIIKTNKIKYLTNSLKIILVLFIIIILWKEISFRLYIPSENMPKDIFSIKQLFEIIKLNIREFFSYKKTYTVLEKEYLSLLLRLSTIIFIIGLITEIFLIFNITKKINIYFKDNIEALSVYAIHFLGAITLSNVIIYLLGLSIQLELIDFLLLWVIIASIILSYKKVHKI